MKDLNSESEVVYLESDVKDSTLNYFHGNVLTADTVVRKYLHRNDKNEYLDLNPDHIHQRIARELAKVESKYPNPLSQEVIYSYLKDFSQIIPQGSPISAIGNKYHIQSTSNCFLGGGVDEKSDSYGGIMKADQEIVQIAKRRGGIGQDISGIRPKGAITKNSAKTSDGIGVFMERYSNSTNEVAQSGRRGALMLTCDVAHPDIYTFATIKNDDKKVTGANISIKLSKEFMDCVKSNKDFYLRYPTKSKLPENIEHQNLEYGELTKIGKQYIKKIKAKDLWDTVNHSAWLRAEPGLLFWDTVVDKSPTTPYKDFGFLSVSTNPCFPSSEYLLTDKGYVKFGDLYKNGMGNIVVTDNRISYESDGEIEKPENWKIDVSKVGTTNRQASSVFLTKKDADILEVKTSLGYKVKCTPDHHIATTQGMVEAKDLTLDHKVLISIPEVTESIVDKLPKTILEMKSLLIGLGVYNGVFDKDSKLSELRFSGEYCFSVRDLVIEIIYKLQALSNVEKVEIVNQSVIETDKNKVFSVISSNWLSDFLSDIDFKDVPEFVLQNSSTDIGKYYLLGLSFNNFVDRHQFSVHEMSIKSKNLSFLEKVQMVLHSNGILSIIENFIPDEYTLTNLANYCVKFGETIGSLNLDVKILDNCPFKDNGGFADSIVSITECPKEDVYCIKEPVTRSIIVNGISARRCGEIVLSPYDSCRLFVVNLCYFVENKFTPKAYFNVDKYLSTVRVAQRLMDDLIDLELDAIDRIIAKVESDPEDWSVKQFEYDLWKRIRVTCENGRRTGLGITGLGDVLAMLNITYGSQESINMTDLIYKNLAKGSYETSIRLASERGSFPVYSYDLEKDHEWLNSIIDILDPEYQEMYKKTGRRNIACNTTAPTGTTSMMSLLGEFDGVKYFGTTSGIEPVFLIGYDRRTKIMTGSTDTPDFVDNLGVKWKTYTVYHSGVELYRQISKDINLVNNPYLGSTSADIDWVNSVKLQGQAQKWVDHSISKTVNVPNNVTQELIANIYMTAYEVGCKGVTVYRDGCRSGVLVETNKKTVEELPQYDAPKRPEKVKAEIHFSHIDRSKWILIVGLIGDKPYELFGGIIPEELQLSKSIKEGYLVKVKKGHYDLLDNDDKVIIKDICNTLNNTTYNFHTRMVSMTLRHGTPVQYLIDQLNRLADKEIGLYTFNKVVVRVLKKFIPNGFKSSGVKCVECGSTNLAYQEGCLTCLDCGNSKCN